MRTTILIYYPISLSAMVYFLSVPRGQSVSPSSFPFEYSSLAYFRSYLHLPFWLPHPLSIHPSCANPLYSRNTTHNPFSSGNYLCSAPTNIHYGHEASYIIQYPSIVPNIFQQHHEHSLLSTFLSPSSRSLCNLID